GDIEHGPLDPVEIEEIAHSVEDNTIVEVAERARQNKAQGPTQKRITSCGLPSTPVGNGDGSHQAHHGKDEVRKGGIIITQTEEGTVVHLGQHLTTPGA